MSLTTSLTYKDITWGKILNKKRHHYTFYPIYDWSYSDVWKYIHDNNLPYNKIYNEMYRHGVNVRDMRISNLHHETSIQALLLVQEIEPKTWNAIEGRIVGVNTIKQMNSEAFTCPKELPYMFKNWKDYATHLAEKMIQNDSSREMLFKEMKSNEKYLFTQKIFEAFYKTVVKTILSSDWDFTKLKNFTTSPTFVAVKKYQQGKITKENYAINKKNDLYIKGLI